MVESRACQAENRPSEEEEKDDLKLKFDVDNYVQVEISILAGADTGSVVSRTIMYETCTWRLTPIRHTWCACLQAIDRLSLKIEVSMESG